VYQSNPVGVELISYLNTFVGCTLHSLRTEIWASEVKPSLIYSAESNIDFGRREEGIQHAAKLQFSVRTKSRTHFVETCLQGF